MANLVVFAYIVVALREDQGEQEQPAVAGVAPGAKRATAVTEKVPEKRKDL